VSKRFRVLELIYISAFFFLFVAVTLTVYGLLHPELGLVEADPLVRAFIVEYGLVVGLLIAILYNSSVLILSWLSFTLYLMFKRRYKWNNTLTDSTAYSLVATVGLYALITWLLNAANDVYVLLFHSNMPLITATMELWTSISHYAMIAVYLFVFLITHACGEELFPHASCQNLSYT
jgi:hypothetical protein